LSKPVLSLSKWPYDEAPRKAFDPSTGSGQAKLSANGLLHISISNRLIAH